MKPLRLEMTAFGPYGSRAEVDFERLSRVGLFVVAGPTGSGKTSIFDALSYALFGKLPGERSDFLQVRSDHADPGVACWVGFEFSADGQRWLVTRRPAWIRPKKRGEGTTEEAAKASLDRWSGGEWVPVESKSRAVTERCEELVGLTQEQFQRVVLLPQGQFQQVLKADSLERRGLLRTLFASGLYERLEDKLKEAAKAAHKELAELNRAQQNDLANAVSGLRLARRSVDVADQAALDQVAAEPEPDYSELTPDEVSELAQTFADGPLAEAKEKLAELDRALAAAAKKREAAELVAADLAARERHTRRKLDLAAQEKQAKAGLEMAKRAESAAPIATQHALVSQHRATRDAAKTALVRAETEMGNRLAALDLAVDYESDFVVATRALVASETEGINRALAVWKEITTAEAEAAGEAAAAQKLEATRDRLSEELAESELRLTTQRRSLSSAEATAALAPSLVAGLETAKANLAHRTKLDRATEFIRSAELDRAAAKGTIEKGRLRLTELEGEIKRLQAESATEEARRSVWKEAEKRQGLRSELEEQDRAVTDKKRRAERATDELNRIMRAFQASTGPRLAEMLAEGEPCSVCGSTDHPNPAAPVGGQELVGLDEVSRGQTSLNAAAVEVSECETKRRSLVESLGEHASVPPADLAAATAEAAARVETAAKAAQDSAKRIADRDRLIGEIGQAELDLERVVADLANQATARAEAEGALGEAKLRPERELVDELADARSKAEQAQQAAESLEARASQLTKLEATLEATRRAQDEANNELTRSVTAADRARARATELSAGVSADRAHYSARQQSVSKLAGLVDEVDGHRRRSAEAETTLGVSSLTLSDLVDQSDHDDLSGALENRLDRREVERLRADFEKWKQESGAVAALLAELAEKDLPDEAPDVAVRKKDERQSRLERDRQASMVTEAETHLGGVSRALAAVGSSEVEVADQRAAAQQITNLADVCSGKGDLKVSLEAWVLAAHLRDVVAAANLHLGPMSSGRYELSVADAPLTKKRQGGLDLVISDSHTGKDRPVASLSGGETFQASLALALGLADVVTANRGGIRIDALFIDEGFGSLDAEALDQAISVLDGLRSRGSLVGIITHVDALKEALTVGIEIRASSNGSELVQRV